LPKEGRFFDLFNAHAEQVVKASHELKLLMDNFENREEHARRIDEAEHAADRITADTIRLLHKTFITPLDRDHIHALVNAMDEIMKMNAMSELLEEITDRCLDVANLAEGISLENS